MAAGIHFSTCAFSLAERPRVHSGHVRTINLPSLLHNFTPLQPVRLRARATARGVRAEIGVESEGELTKDELRQKGSEFSTHLQGSSIFLVGTAQSEKASVGRCLAEALGYYFFDSMQLVEQAAGERLSEMSTEEFDDAETEVLMQLSPLVRLVVATGERVVLKPRNWGYLRDGVSVWLSWAENLHKESLYANADATVAVERIAALKGEEDLTRIAPATLALHVLEEIDRVVKKRNVKAPH